VQTFRLERAWRLGLADLGVNPTRLLRRADLPADLLTRAEPTVTADGYFRLWDALADEVDDPHVGLAVGKMVTVEMFSPPLFAGLCSPDLATAADRLQRYKQLVGPIRMEVDHADGLTISLHALDRPSLPEQLGVMEATFWVSFARLGTRAQVQPRSVQLPVELTDPATYTDYFGVPVEAGDAVRVQFSELDARRPFLTSDEGMWSFFEPELRRRLSEVRADASTAERVRASLLELLPSGRATMGGVARSLGVSSRTLQRRLAGEGTGYQEVLDATREQLARHYLAASSMGVSEISFLLGYEDPNSFFRAFQRWTGQTPESMRSRPRA